MFSNTIGQPYQDPMKPGPLDLRIRSKIESVSNRLLPTGKGLLDPIMA